MIFYIHGFNSSGQSSKAAYLKKRFPGADFFTPSYPNDLTKAIPFLEEFISFHLKKIDRQAMLIGSSLGGFFSLYLGKKFKTRVCLINPSLDPVTTLKKYVGENKNYYTGETYQLLPEQLEKLRNYYLTETPDVPLLVLLDEDDEILDSRASLEKFRNSATVKLYPGGSHQFDHLEESVPDIKAFYENG